jgi:hypothetical protein
MEAVWIILGGLISTISGVVAWHFNSQTSRDIQERQQKHELAMQEQRLEAERKNRQDEAIRAARRVGLEPVLNLMAEVEGGYTYRFWKSVVEKVGKDNVFDATLTDLAADLFPDGMPADARARVVRDMVDVVPQPSPEILARAAAVIPRINDENLRRDMFFLVSGLFSPISDFRVRFLKVADVHTRLERYAASTD